MENEMQNMFNFTPSPAFFAVKSSATLWATDSSSSDDKLDAEVEGNDGWRQ